MLAAGHGVPHARARQDVHVVHDDKRLLLEGDDGQVVLVGVLVAVRVVPGPHWEHQRQGSVLPAAHLQENRSRVRKKGSAEAFLLTSLVLYKGRRSIVIVRKLFTVIILTLAFFDLILIS